MKKAWAFLGIERPLIQAPMAGAQDAELAIAVSSAGGLGSLPCAMLTPEAIKIEVARIRRGTDKPFNLNFFCHQNPPADPQKIETWKTVLAPYFKEFGVDANAAVSSASRNPFDEALCLLMEELRPPVISFHFGLPPSDLVARLKKLNIVILSSATTVAEALWLEAHGCDGIIAQGFEAGGHRGNFLNPTIDNQVGTLALVPQIVDAVKVPVIASGGISEIRGVKAAYALGASAVQVGTAFLYTPEAKISKVHLSRLKDKENFETALTNVFTGRPARGMVNRLMKELGPMSSLAPSFPLAGGPLAPLRAKTEGLGMGDFMPLWAGQAGPLCKEMPAGELTRALTALET